MFNDNGIVGIDIDNGYDADGFLSPIAADIIGKCKSYTERSKSGRGFHILLRGELPFKGKNNRNGVEIYNAARFFIMTGDVLLFSNITENQQAIDYVVGKYFPETKESNGGNTNPKIYTPIWENPVTDGIVKVRPTYPIIGDGGRNISLTSLAGQLHTIGYDRSVILTELRYVNQTACKPPLDDGEIMSIVTSITKYKR